jgi:hypothetical protein
MARKVTKAPRWDGLLKIFGLFMGTGALLFFRVWWPIQAERSALTLQRLDGRVFQKKSELNMLNERYAALTTLPLLDQWSKRHGAWVPASAENVLLLP